MTDTNHIEVLQHILDGTPSDTLHEDHRRALDAAITALSTTGRQFTPTGKPQECDTVEAAVTLAEHALWQDDEGVRWVPEAAYQRMVSEVERLETALSARAGEGGGDALRWVKRQIEVARKEIDRTIDSGHMAQHYAAHEALKQLRAIETVLATAPQPAQAGATGGGDALAKLYEAASVGFHVTETSGLDGKYWHVSKFRSMDDLHVFAEAWRTAMTSVRDTTPASPATGDIEPDAIVSTDREGDMFIDVRSVTLKHGDKLYRYPPTPQPAAAQGGDDLAVVTLREKIANAVRNTGRVSNSDKWEVADAVIAALAAAPQPQVPAGALAGELRDATETHRLAAVSGSPPAHGDGEVILADDLLRAIDRIEGDAQFYEWTQGRILAEVRKAIEARSMDRPTPEAQEAPVPVRIDCPQCTAPHVDEGEWATRPHKTHQCQACGHEWRPFPYATVGTPPAQATVKESLTVHPAHGDGEGLGTGDFYGNGSELPTLHPDPLTNAEILIQSLCARLDTARQALADAAAMQVVQPALQRIKANAAWAISETAPGRMEPRSAKWNLTTRPTPEDAADARRYRWLREKHNDRESDICVMYEHGLIEDITLMDPECLDLDAAIDAALALPAQGEGK